MIFENVNGIDAIGSRYSIDIFRRKRGWGGGNDRREIDSLYFKLLIWFLFFVNEGNDKCT